MKPLFICALLFIAPAAFPAEGFLIKGVRVGDTPESACGTSPITDRAAELAESMREFGTHLKPASTNECEGAITSFAGMKLKEPSHMLFLDRRLIAIKIQAHPMEMTRLDNVLSTMRSEFGKPTIKSDHGLITFTWRRWGQTLIVERESESWDENHVTVILREDKGFSRFMKRNTENSQLIDATVRQEVRNDVLK